MLMTPLTRYWAALGTFVRNAGTQNWLDTLLPSKSCLLCKQDSSCSLCAYCKGDLDGFELGAFDHNLFNWPKAAQGLVSGLQQPGVPRLLALADYQWPFNQLITGLKFSAKLSHARALGELFAERALPNTLPEAIIPVPLHWRRMFKRKFNQSQLIAQHISRLSGLPLLNHCLHRNKATQAQSQLTKKQRLDNLRNAFTAQPVDGLKRVALFDDVITTGATSLAAIKALQKANPHLQIELWALCLTINQANK